MARILIIDDDETVRNTAATMLEARGFDVVHGVMPREGGAPSNPCANCET
jgi:FixJ family two-component response regulator